MFLAVCPETSDRPLQTLGAQASVSVSGKRSFGGPTLVLRLIPEPAKELKID